MDADQTETMESPRQPSTTALAILLAITLIALLLLGWVWYSRYAPVHYDIGPDVTISDAEGARYILPILFGGVVLIAVFWLVTWFLARWTFTILPMAIAVIGGIALLAALFGVWRGWSNSHEIIVMTYLCEDDAERMTPASDGLPDGCEVVPDIQGVTLGTTGDPTLVRPDASSNSLSRFSDLPRGTYSATITAQGRSNTATAILGTETRNGIRAMSPLQHQQGATWSGPMTLHPNLETYYLLLYPSPYEEAPNAGIRISVQECSGTSLANFDASACQPIPLSGPVAELQPANPAGRPAATSLDTGGMTFSDLEQRSYTFTPELPVDALLTGRSDMLVIPADGPQTSDRNILVLDAEHPRGAFTVDVTGDEENLEYTIYVFVENITVARRSDVRP
jgi:hypothetical protein